MQIEQESNEKDSLCFADKMIFRANIVKSANLTR